VEESGAGLGVHRVLHLRAVLMRAEDPRTGDMVQVPPGARLAFTGHRPEKLGGYGPANDIRDLVRWTIRATLREVRPAMVYGGMALGLDTWVAEVCIDVGQPWTACVPFRGQESRWPAKAQHHYRWLLERASRVDIVCEGGYAPHKMQRRNRRMVDLGECLVAFWDGSSGGTGNCVQYAREVGRLIARATPPAWTFVTETTGQLAKSA
jgi:uncharacterized phage-like protein YoqJ